MSYGDCLVELLLSYEFVVAADSRERVGNFPD